MKTPEIYAIVIATLLFFCTKLFAYDELIFQAQSALESKGYAVGTKDGVWGENTKGALVAFQLKSGIKPTGILDSDSINALALSEYKKVIESGQIIFDRSFCGYPYTIRKYFNECATASKAVSIETQAVKKTQWDCALLAKGGHTPMVKDSLEIACKEAIRQAAVTAETKALNHLGNSNPDLKRDFLDYANLGFLPSLDERQQSPTIDNTGVNSERALSPTQLFRQASKSVFVVITNQGTGSAVAVRSNKLVTNCHVVGGDRDQIVVVQNTNKWDAKVTYELEEEDICILDIGDGIVQHTTLGSTNSLAVGSKLYAVGAPRGLELSFTEGLLSQKRSPEGFGIKRQGANVLQISVPISPGSSGGGLFNSAGRLVGITTSALEDSQNLNFAMPVEWVNVALSGLDGKQ